MTSDWQRLLPDADFRFRMGVRPGDARRFFAPPENSDELLSLRALALDRHPSQYAAALPESLPWVCEAVRCMTEWRPAYGVDLNAGALAICLDAGRRVEADWVLLSPNSELQHPVVGGVVCFPSSWSLPEKLGLPMPGVHGPVPGLNENLGRSIDTFLSRLEPGAIWERENWGLSADAELDHHPSQPRQSLDEQATLESSWLRWERQLLTRLPDTQSILFGIKVSTHRLDEIAAMPDIGRRLARALRTMPEDIAEYKGLTRCRDALVKRLCV